MNLSDIQKKPDSMNDGELKRIEAILNGCGVLGKTNEDKIRFLIDQRNTSWGLSDAANIKLKTIKELI